VEFCIEVVMNAVHRLVHAGNANLAIKLFVLLARDHNWVDMQNKYK